MGTFSDTELPVNDLGLSGAPYPAICQVESDLWVLLSDFSFTRDNGRVITAPAGMTTDMASIPRVAWDILPPFGKYTGAAVIHDFLYQTQPCSREEADQVLWEAMQAAGVEHVTLEIIYHAVRVGGQEAWDHYTIPPTSSRGTSP